MWPGERHMLNRRRFCKSTDISPFLPALVSHSVMNSQMAIPLPKRQQSRPRTSRLCDSFHFSFPFHSASPAYPFFDTTVSIPPRSFPPPTPTYILYIYPLHPKKPSEWVWKPMPVHFLLVHSMRNKFNFPPSAQNSFVLPILSPGALSDRYLPKVWVKQQHNFILFTNGDIPYLFYQTQI